MKQIGGVIGVGAAFNHQVVSDGVSQGETIVTAGAPLPPQIVGYTQGVSTLGVGVGGPIGVGVGVGGPIGVGVGVGPIGVGVGSVVGGYTGGAYGVGTSAYGVGLGARGYGYGGVTQTPGVVTNVDVAGNLTQTPVVVTNRA